MQDEEKEQRPQRYSGWITGIEIICLISRNAHPFLHLMSRKDGAMCHRSK